MKSIQLLEPYRSALLTMGIQEKLVSIPANVDPAKSPFWNVGNDRHLQEVVLQMAILFEQISIVHHEDRNTVADFSAQGIDSPGMLALQDMGIVNFIEGEIPDNQKSIWENASEKGAKETLHEAWWSEIKNIDLWTPVILSQLQARGKPIEANIFELMRACRLHDKNAKKAARKKIRNDQEELAEMIEDSEESFMIDFVVFTTLSELLITEKEREKTNSRLALAEIEEQFLLRGKATERQRNSAKNTHSMFKILAEEILQEELFFEIPESLEDVSRIRNKPEVVSFRDSFLPWLDSISESDTDTEKKLRKEVKKHLKYFKNHQRIRRMSEITAYASLGIGLLEPISGIATGLLSIGLPKLADKWESEGKWVGLFSK